jgi:imidazolonepropionase
VTMKTDSTMLFVNASQVVTCAGAARARFGKEMSGLEVLSGVAVAVGGDKIAELGPLAALEKKFPKAEYVDCSGRVLTPGLVDSHTHAIFARPRYEEQEMRAAGVDYKEIARRGGGIHSSVKHLRACGDDDLYAYAVPRLKRLASYGTTTVEVKSGYGLSIDDELRILRVIARLQQELPMRIVPTWLGAHEIPLEFRERNSGRTEYLDLLINDLLPLVVRDGLARFADVFCEPGVFTVDETRRILHAASGAGLLLKLHADELDGSGGAELAAELKATSADHLAAISDEGIRALAQSKTVATLLPGTMLFLGRQKQAPARALIDGGVPVALATDFNPGTSPTCNFPLILTLGISQLKMSAGEAFIAATVNGAGALGLAGETGQIAPGFSADIALFEADDYRELAYWYGDRRCTASWSRGKPCHPSALAIA